MCLDWVCIIYRASFRHWAIRHYSRCARAVLPRRLPVTRLNFIKWQENSHLCARQVSLFFVLPYYRLLHVFHFNGLECRLLFVTKTIGRYSNIRDARFSVYQPRQIDRSKVELGGCKMKLLRKRRVDRKCFVSMSFVRTINNGLNRTLADGIQRVSQPRGICLRRADDKWIVRRDAHRFHAHLNTDQWTLSLYCWCVQNDHLNTDQWTLSLYCWCVQWSFCLLMWRK